MNLNKHSLKFNNCYFIAATSQFAIESTKICACIVLTVSAKPEGNYLVSEATFVDS